MNHWSKNSISLNKRAISSKAKYRETWKKKNMGKRVERKEKSITISINIRDWIEGKRKLPWRKRNKWNRNKKESSLSIIITHLKWGLKIHISTSPIAVLPNTLKPPLNPTPEEPQAPIANSTPNLTSTLKKKNNRQCPTPPPIQHTPLPNAPIPLPPLTPVSTISLN